MFGSTLFADAARADRPFFFRMATWNWCGNALADDKLTWCICLRRAEHFHRRVKRPFADFIAEDRAAVGFLETPDLAF